VESSTLQGREEEKERGVLHPKSRSDRKKGKLHPFFAFFYGLLLLFFIFLFL
jgi:hypothetical protein